MSQQQSEYGYKKNEKIVTIVLCWHLLERCNDVDMIADVDLKLCWRHQDALALQSGSRFLPAVAQLQQRPQRRAVTSTTGGCCYVQGLHSLQRPQTHRGNISHFLHCNTGLETEGMQQQKPEQDKKICHAFVSISSGECFTNTCTYLAVDSPPD